MFGSGSKLSDEFFSAAGRELGHALDLGGHRNFGSRVEGINTRCAEEESKKRNWFPPAKPRFLGVQLEKDFKDSSRLHIILDLSELTRRLIRASVLGLGTQELLFDREGMKQNLARLIGKNPEEYARKAAISIVDTLDEFRLESKNKHKAKNALYCKGDPVQFELDLKDNKILIITSREQNGSDDRVTLHSVPQPTVLQRLTMAIRLG